MAYIKILPEYLANQIAAGEVVQRPESVVKELVENALDAGATSVSVVVRGAGKQLIHVIDNGKGMQAEDLILSVVRHATSKIQTEADLHAISTLGFRGEALASIAAVADVEVRTLPRALNDTDDVPEGSEQTAGHVLTSRPGEPAEIKAAASSPGTQIIVRNLFYNVPARRKFLKSDLTEFRQVSETMQRMALSRPDVRFTFHDGDALVFDVRPTSLKERIRELLGIDSERGLLPVDMEESGIHVQGFIGLPNVSRQSRSGQYLFLNGRSISSRALAHAVLTAYEHLLESGQHPVFVLHLTVDPHHVDVNVHPQKNEVKFEDERSAYLLVQAATTRALRSAEVIPAFLGDLPLASQPLQSLPQSPSGGITYVNRLTGEVHQSSFQQGGMPPSIRSMSGSKVSATLLAPPEQPETLPILQVGSQFLLMSSPEGVMVIDQHAAHERVLYEQAMSRGGQATHGEQALLFSVKISLSPSDVALVKEYLTEFQALGFRLDVHDAATVEVHSVPTDVQPGSEERVLSQIIDGLQNVGAIPRERRLESLAAIYAAKQAIRRGDRLSADEARMLVTNLLACAMPHFTPDGKPTLFLLPFDELVSRLR